MSLMELRIIGLVKSRLFIFMILLGKDDKLALMYSRIFY